MFKKAKMRIRPLSRDGLVLGQNINRNASKDLERE